MQLLWTFFSTHCEFFPKKVSSLHKLPIMWRRCKSFTLKKWPKAASAAPQHSPVIYIFPKQFAVLLYPFLRQNGISKKHLMVSTKRRKKALQLRVGIFCRENKIFFCQVLEKKSKIVYSVEVCSLCLIKCAYEHEFKNN